MKQLVAAVRQLHRLNIVHLSLHPRWIWLYNGVETAKIGNFSHAVCLGNEHQTYNYLLAMLKSAEMIAPEVRLNKPATLKADIYSLGMVYGWMRYQTFDFRFRLAKDLNMRDQTAELINKMTTMDPNTRIDIEAVAMSFAQQITNLNKSSRTPTSVLSKPFGEVQRSITPTATGFERLNMLNRSSKGMQPTASTTPNTKLTTLAALRNKNMSEDKPRDGFELKSRSVTKVGANNNEAAVKAHVNKLLKERVQYNYLLAVVKQILAEGEGKPKPRLLLFMLAKKARIVAVRCRPLLKQVIESKSHGNELIQLHEIVDAEIVLVEQYFKTSRKLLQGEQLKVQYKPSIDIELSRDNTINSQFFASTVLNYVNACLPTSATIKPRQRATSQETNKHRSTLVLLLKLLECRNLEHFANEFLNETGLCLEQQPYFVHLGELTAEGLHNLLTSKLV